MDLLVATVLAMCVALGCIMLFQGLRGKAVLPSLSDIAPGVSAERVLAWFAAGLMTGLLLYSITGWIVLAVTAGGTVVFGHRVVGGDRERRDFIARTEAIATWAELIRDNIAGAAGLEQSLIASAAYAPAPIAPEVKRFAGRLDRMRLTDALRMLGDELDHHSADLIVVSLSNAARMEARDLGPLLTRLSESIRSDVRMRLRVEVGRARIRTSARMVTLTTAGTIVFIYFASNNLLDAYSTAQGQLWLLLVIGVFGTGWWMLRQLAQFDMPERFSARRLSASPDEALAHDEVRTR